MSPRARFAGVVRYAVLALFFALAAYPVLWMVSTGLKGAREAAGDWWGPPGALQWSNFAEVWKDGGYLAAFLNSLAVSASAVVATVALAAPAGYALARLRFRGSRGVFLLFLAGMMVPVHVTLIPLLRLFDRTGLYDTLAGLAAVYTAFNLPVAVVLFAAFFREVPREVEEAAALDGCGAWGTFRLIALPLARPAVVGVVVLTLVNVWNEFALALVLLRDKQTLPLVVQNLRGEYGGEVHLVAAALAIAVVPPLVVYALAQRHLVRGLTAGAVKG